VKGVRVCPQGKRKMAVGLYERVDPKGRPYYWIGGAREDASDNPQSDIALLQQGFITVTPLCLDLTDYKIMDHIEAACRPA
jgi:5'-nucleotidase